jgi:hypothetical protein
MECLSIISFSNGRGLTALGVPDAAHEALRDPGRARLAAKRGHRGAAVAQELPRSLKALRAATANKSSRPHRALSASAEHDQHS